MCFPMRISAGEWSWISEGRKVRTDFSRVSENLRRRGYSVRVFDGKEEASDYLDKVIHRQSVGIGGSSTIDSLDVYDRLCRHNEVFWHWKKNPDGARKDAMNTDVYLCSTNALAETGEMVNIDGIGNRAASMLFGHERVYYVVGRNKLVSDYAAAVWRARNIAAPQRARQLRVNAPCAAKADRCYDCQGPGRICKGMVTLWGPMNCMRAEVLLVDEDLGL